MTNIPSAPREFWIACPDWGDNYDYTETIVSKDPACTKTERDFKFNSIHVIEHSAYLAEKKRARYAEAKLKAIEINRTLRGYDGLADKYDKAVAALKSLLWHFDNDPEPDGREFVSETLKGLGE